MAEDPRDMTGRNPEERPRRSSGSRRRRAAQRAVAEVLIQKEKEKAE